MEPNNPHRLTRDVVPSAYRVAIDTDLGEARFTGTVAIDATVEQAKVLGVTLPDPDLKWNEQRQSYDFGPIDWSEFKRVIAGDGPCNRERLQARVDAWEDGAWVREASLAHAEKRAARAHAKAA